MVPTAINREPFDVPVRVDDLKSCVVCGAY